MADGIEGGLVLCVGHWRAWLRTGLGGPALYHIPRDAGQFAAGYQEGNLQDSEPKFNAMRSDASLAVGVAHSPISRIGTFSGSPPGAPPGHVREHDNQQKSPSFPPLTPRDQLRESQEGSGEAFQSFEPTQVNTEKPTPATPVEAPPGHKEKADENEQQATNTPESEKPDAQANVQPHGAVDGKAVVALGESAQNKPPPANSPATPKTAARPFPLTHLRRMATTVSKAQPKAGSKKSIYQGGLYWKCLG